MKKWQKIGLGILIAGTIAAVKFAYFPNSENTKINEEQPETVVQQKAPESNVSKNFVYVYFIGENDKREEVYKAIKRTYDVNTDGTKLKFAITTLLKGPNAKEKSKGVYSEIPSNTKLISIEEYTDRVIINLSSDFENGGGTDSVYKRAYQLIKTANKNTTSPVYLNINGKQVDVLGGEGIMLNQPLNNKSLDE